MRAIPVLEPIDNVINAVGLIVKSIFLNNATGYMRMLLETIMNSPYLLVGVVLLVCGFVIGILSRIIRV